jgi:hypothetical protein
MRQATDQSPAIASGILPPPARLNRACASSKGHKCQKNYKACSSALDVGDIGEAEPSCYREGNEEACFHPHKAP